MTGHFTSYENRTDHELATMASLRLDTMRNRHQTPDIINTPIRL